MKLFEKLFSFYIKSSLHVAIACTALVCLTFYQLEAAFDIKFLLFSLCLSVLGYNFVKYFLLLVSAPKSIKGSIILFSIISGIGAFFLFAGLNFSRWYILVPFVILTFMYVFPLPEKGTNLRTFPGLKIFIIAIVWTGITYIVPLFYLKVLPDSFLSEILQRFILLLVLMIPFEIRDFNEDDFNLRTLPQQLGVRVTKYVGYLFTVILVGIGYFQYKWYEISFIPDLGLGFLLLLLLFFTKKEQNIYFSSFWVESVPIYYTIGHLLIA